MSHTLVHIHVHVYYTQDTWAYCITSELHCSHLHAMLEWYSSLKHALMVLVYIADFNSDNTKLVHETYGCARLYNINNIMLHYKKLWLPLLATAHIQDIHDLHPMHTMHTITRTRIHTHTHTHAHAHTRAHTHTCTHTCTYTRTHTHTHTHTCWTGAI